MTIGLLLAGVVGLSLGMLGGGGSILAVPIFVYVLGYGVKQAIAMSLAVVGATSLFAALGHWRRGNVDLRVALIFGPVAMAGAYGGARLSALVSGSFQLTLFAAVMLLSAVFMLRGNSVGPGDGGSEGGGAAADDAADDGADATADATGNAVPEGPMPVPLIVVEALFVGILTGLVGVGGGFLVVPALVLLGKIPIKVAVGTSLLVIAMNAASGFVGYLGHVELPWLFMGAFAATATAGALWGSWLVLFVPQNTLRRSFAAFLVVMGAVILYENRATFMPAHPTPHALPHAAVAGGS